MGSLTDASTTPDFEYTRNSLSVVAELRIPPPPLVTPRVQAGLENLSRLLKRSMNKLVNEAEKDTSCAGGAGM